MKSDRSNPKNQFLLIIDGSSLLATSYYSSLPKRIRREKDEEKKKQLYPKLLHRDKNGNYINALELFFHTLFTILTFQRPTHLVICWDVTRNTFRKDLWESYKANRSETPQPLREQFESAYEICEELGFRQYRDARFEADDFAGTLAWVMEKRMKVRILTRDKDYFQLISDQTKIWYGMSDLDKVKEWRKKHQMNTCLPSRVVEIDRDVVQEEFGYLPEALPMIKALSGDASDNIPGVSGMGEIRSMKLAEHYHSPEDLYRDIERADTAARKKRLNSRWQQWGIRKSPISCLTRKSTPKRKSAREMADLCFILGTIRKDIDLSEYSGCDFSEDLLKIRPDYDAMDKILESHEIRLQIGRRKRTGRAVPKERQTAQRAGSSSRQDGRGRARVQDRPKTSAASRKAAAAAKSNGRAASKPARMQGRVENERLQAGSASQKNGKASVKPDKARTQKPASQKAAELSVKNKKSANAKTKNEGASGKKRRRRRPSNRNWEKKENIAPVLQASAVSASA